jgi:hypothetical protein
MSTPSLALIKLTQDKTLTAVLEAQQSLFSLYATIGQQLAAIAARIASARALIDDPKVVSAFPSNDDFRTEVEKMETLLVQLQLMVDSIPDTPRIGE